MRRPGLTLAIRRNEFVREMRNLRSPKLMWLKGILFLMIGSVSAVLLWLEAPEWRRALLLALTIWGFCRAYYFAFYVLEKHVNPGFRFAGLISLISHLLKHGRKPGNP